MQSVLHFSSWTKLTRDRWPSRTPRYSLPRLSVISVFCLMVSSPRPITQMHSASPASFSCISSGQYNSLYLRKQQWHWYMPSSAVDLTTATACLMVSAISCCTGCKWSRMTVFFLSLELKSTSLWRQYCVFYIGYRSNSGSLLRQQSWRTSVFTA